VEARSSRRVTILRSGNQQCSREPQRHGDTKKRPFTTDYADDPARRSRNQTQNILQEATEETEIDPEKRGDGQSVNGVVSAII
jgi:hypothetical protein